MDGMDGVDGAGEISGGLPLITRASYLGRPTHRCGVSSRVDTEVCVRAVADMKNELSGEDLRVELFAAVATCLEQISLKPPSNILSEAHAATRELGARTLSQLLSIGVFADEVRELLDEEVGS